MNGKPQEKQGYGSVPQQTVNFVLLEARGTALSKNALPGKQEERMMIEAETLVNELIKQANAFFDGAWKNTVPLQKLHL